MEITLQGKDSVTVKNAYAPTSSARMEKWNNFMMILKEQWLIATPNITSLQEISMQKLELKQKEEDFKSMGAFGIGERNKRGDRSFEFAEEHNLIIATTTTKQKKQMMNLGVTRWGNKKPNGFHIE